ncbi:glycosyltransferase family 2 protein [Candidatus Omnitrophota bacterium]
MGDDSSIIIVTYNSSQFITDCLDSVVEQTSGESEVIIIDNHSTDLTVELIRHKFPHFCLISNKENLGFSEAVNQGIRLSAGRYIFVLNSDVVLCKDFIEQVMKTVTQLPDNVGMLSPKIMRMDGQIIDSTGLMLSKSIRFFDRGSGEEDHGQYDSDNAILGPCAAVGIYRRDMLEDIEMDGEYFDKDFFYLVEDFDIVLRARKKGWKGAYLPNAIGYHIRNGSCVSFQHRQYYSFRNRYFLIIKNLKITPYLIFIFFTYDIPRSIFMLLSNKYTLKAVRDVLAGMFKMLEKRKDIAKNCTKNRKHL